MKKFKITQCLDFKLNIHMKSGFPGSSAGKESACNTGDPSLIPGLGRSTGDRNGYTLQYSDLENFTDCILHGSQRVGHD